MMRKKILIAALSAVAMMAILQWQGRELISSYSPCGIVSFELAKHKTVADNIVSTVGKIPLRINVSIDFAFIIAYSLFFYLSCKALMNHFRSSGMKTLGFIFMELGVLAGVLDLCENIVMLITLTGDYGSQLSITITYWAAIAKFIIAALVLAYIIIAFVVTRFTKEKTA